MSYCIQSSLVIDKDPAEGDPEDPVAMAHENAAAGLTFHIINFVAMAAFTFVLVFWLSIKDFEQFLSSFFQWGRSMLTVFPPISARGIYKFEICKMALPCYFLLLSPQAKIYKRGINEWKTFQLVKHNNCMVYSLYRNSWRYMPSEKLKI